MTTLRLIHWTLGIVIVGGLAACAYLIFVP